MWLMKARSTGDPPLSNTKLSANDIWKLITSSASYYLSSYNHPVFSIYSPFPHLRYFFSFNTHLALSLSFWFYLPPLFHSFLISVPTPRLTNKISTQIILLLTICTFIGTHNLNTCHSESTSAGYITSSTTNSSRFKSHILYGCYIFN